MPKAKKGNKKPVQGDSDNEEIIDLVKSGPADEEEITASAETTTSKKKRKDKKKGKPSTRDDSDDDEIENRLKALTLNNGDDSPQPKQTKKIHKPTPGAASAFSMLGADSDESNRSEDERSRSPSPIPQPVKEAKPKQKKVKKTKEPSPGEEDLDAILNSINDDGITDLPDHSGDEGEKTSKKKKKKEKKGKKAKGKQQAEEEQDLDAIIASLDNNTEPVQTGKIAVVAIKPDMESAAEPSTEPEKQKSPIPDTIAAESQPMETQDVTPVEETPEEPAAMSKSKKKREKKKQKQEESAEAKPATVVEPTEETVTKEKGEAEAGERAEAGEAAEAGEGAEGGKKRKRKKKKVEVVEKPDEIRKPRNKAIAAMKEALAKAKEEEERIEREELEKERKHEEARLAKIEEKRVKEEARLKKKEKERERLARRKQDGNYMTPQQKADRERAMQMLEAHGIEVPQPGSKAKMPTYGKKRDRGKKAESKKPTEESTTPSPVAAEMKPVVVKAQEKAHDKTLVEPTEEKEETKDSWDAESEDEIKDTWDAESEDEKESPKVEVAQPVPEKPVTVEPAVDEHSSEDEESSEESESEEDSDESSEDESSSEEEQLTPKERALNRIRKRQTDAEATRSTDVLRAPVVCVLGHVDTGKTKILDKLRRTNVQDGEAGGITQQIGATNVPLEAIQKQTTFVKDFDHAKLKVPGLLIIDTPGHESFSNLRSRGQSLCDIAILVIDIMHGLEPQTIESINLLRKGKTPFIVALNKIDRLYGWKTSPHQDVQNCIKKQTPNTKQEFDELTQRVITQLAEQSLNAALFYENPNPKEYISLVPTSAHSGDGMGNLIALLCSFSQTYLAKRVSVCDNLQATVMEVKTLPGLGTTVDVILVNGKLNRDDVVVLPGTEGPIVTHIRDLLLPEPMRELRVKSAYRHMAQVDAAQGVKLVGKDFDKVMAGLPMYVAKYKDEIEVYKDWITVALSNVLNSIKLSPLGVFVQASTLGSLEALLEYLRSVKIPYAGINIGPVHKKDVMRASTMAERSEELYAVILAFDVRVENDAQELADSNGVKIFTADIIYHLFDNFNKYQEELLERGRRESNHLKVFPCKLRVLPQFIFNARDPIIMGVVVEDGFLAHGTPICVPSKEFTNLGIVTSIEHDHKTVDKAHKGMEVAIKIENIPGQAPRLYGRHFDEQDILVSKISRESIDAVKKYFKKDMSKNDWKLVIDLKKIFDIM